MTLKRGTMFFDGRAGVYIGMNGTMYILFVVGTQPDGTVLSVNDIVSHVREWNICNQYIH